jgi:hypothetical protein
MINPEDLKGKATPGPLCGLSGTVRSARVLTLKIVLHRSVDKHWRIWCTLRQTFCQAHAEKWGKV